ncbi:efflux transporter outer membrane subunit [Cupriavidus neocaledonicus]|uniref:Component of acridine efflux pump, outer membrane lipoprotein n=1 Tax=Cupriavidus neocaledonicus TaxID=1040979 RepID=A0A375H896_9BURK|nr:efflux transporter outer membrane subunit [Cupriavidus neocaledonicus]SOZ36251.1 component of acridine efflux pump, outer membrane lipoprotein [Cupriavidus neocaledonicus]SPD48211.1 Component of acridine efflux pump, outer membrane lipoprotein [Cupriavidus neocaledonicus]
MSARAWLLGACAVAALGGCAIGPDYQRPATPEVAQYRIDTGPLAIAADSDWWNQFNDPVLTALVDEALASNFDVRIAAARIDEFRGQLMVARSGFFPQLNLSASAARQRLGTFNGTPFAGLDSPRNAYQLLANASWELDLWGRIRRQAEAAEAGLWNAEYARRGVVLSLAASVVQGYATLRGLDAQLDIAKQTLASRGDGLDIFRQRYEGGVISQMELAQAENDFYVAEATIPPLRTAIAQTENALSVLLGREPGPVERGKAVTALQAPSIGADMPAALLSRRPDVLQAEQSAIAANAQLGAAQALYLPAVNLSGLFGAIASTPGALWHSASQVWGFGAGLAQPIFQGGAIRGQVQTSSAQRDQAMLAYQRTVLEALADVNTALANGTETRTRLGSLREQEKSLTIYADQAFARYEGGYSSYLEVTNAREKLFNAQLAVIQGQVDTLTSTAALYKSLGGGWPSVPQAVREAGMQGDAKVLAR